MIKNQKYFLLKKGELNCIISNAIKKAGSERKLAKELSISKATIYFLKFEKRNISELYLNKLMDYLDLSVCDFNIISEFSSNWGQKKGGKIAVQNKKENGTFEKSIRSLHKSSSENMKKWHKKMKKEEPEKYYKWQYDRFKKVGRGYPYTIDELNTK